MGIWWWWWSGWWFGTMEFYDFLFSWECHHPNSRTHIFQRGWNQQPAYVFSEVENQQVFGWQDDHLWTVRPFFTSKTWFRKHGGCGLDLPKGIGEGNRRLSEHFRSDFHRGQYHNTCMYPLLNIQKNDGTSPILWDNSLFRLGHFQ